MTKKHSCCSFFSVSTLPWGDKTLRGEKTKNLRCVLLKSYVNLICRIFAVNSCCSWCEDWSEHFASEKLKFLCCLLHIWCVKTLEDLSDKDLISLLSKWSNPALFHVHLSGMYKSGITPYPAQPFHYGPRHVGPSLTPPAGPGPAPPPASMTHPGADSTHGPSRAPAPYGLISELPLPVPTGDPQVNWWSVIYIKLHGQAGKHIFLLFKEYFWNWLTGFGWVCCQYRLELWHSLTHCCCAF